LKVLEKWHDFEACVEAIEIYDGLEFGYLCGVGVGYIWGLREHIHLS
jgi:hypothetical protein